MRYPAILTKRQGRSTLRFPGCEGLSAEVGREGAERAGRAALSDWLEATLKARAVPPLPLSRVRAGRGEQLLWIDVPAQLSVKVSIRSAREAAGLTQKDLARRARVSQPAIARMENPTSNPTLGTLQRIADALGATLSVALELA